MNTELKTPAQKERQRYGDPVSVLQLLRLLLEW